MCGIAGFFDGNADFTANREKYENILQKMQQSILHRGPDEQGIYLGKRAGLAHTRLSIIDLKDGSQPMSRRRGKNSYQIVYNGEIYNAGELRKTLQQKGWRFQTTSDTEVILLAFLEYGPEFVIRLNGIFAFAILDERHDTLYLYRDSFGIKPLFYTQQNGMVLFGSEPKAILSYPGVKAQLDEKGLCELLGMGPARIPGSGLYHGFSEVKPGCYLTVNRYGLQNRQYWRLSSHPHEDDYDTTIAKTRQMLVDVIERQMVSDVPICTFLSGGVDSSVVSAVCAAKLRRQGENLFGKVLVMGIAFHISLQVLINVGVVLTIIPNTGASLPFISYGGSAVLFTLAEMGIVLSVNRYHMRRSLQRKRAELEKEEEQ